MRFSGRYVFRGKQKKKMESSFLSPEQVASEMNELAKCYDTDLSNADLQETRKILGTTSLSDELSEMREENR